MDPLSALGVAAAVVQFVDIGSRVLIAGWERYKKIETTDKVSKNEKLREKRDREVEMITEELNFLDSGLHLPSIKTGDSQPPTPAQAHLSKAISDCRQLSSHLDDVADRIVAQLKVKSDGKAPKTRPRLTRLPFTNREDPNLEIEREIEDIKSQCDAIRRRAIDSVILCIWDDSKQTKQWELHFSKKLDAVMDLLQNVEKLSKQPQFMNQQGSTQNRHNLATEAFQGFSRDPRIGLLTGSNIDTTRSKEALLQLVEAGQSVSLVNLGDEILRSLDSDAGTTASVRTELVELLWRKDWKMDASIPGASATGTSPNVDATMVAHATSAGARFGVVDTREEAIAKTFGGTYRWILQSEPLREVGQPMWESFPEWLADDSNRIYWITGKPGSGKSTMMKFLLQQPVVRESLSKHLGSLHLLIVRFYAWHSGEDLQKSVEGLKRTLISQTLDAFPELTPILSPRRWTMCQVLRSLSGLPPWKIWEVDEAFETLLSQCGKAIKLALFIDGLDEFDMPPKQVISQVREITARCPTGLKVCVASRPWNEFNDEFCDGPMLQMHLLTRADMATFVAEKFKGNKAVAEQEQLNPEVTAQLVADIVKRANGVFLWVSIVVPHLLDLVTDGQSIFQSREIQKILEDLPTDLKALYKKIWASIRPEYLPHASYMMQILDAAAGPLPWFNMWLIEELKSSPVDVQSLSGDDHLRGYAMQSLKRKLAGRTKGILELNAEGRGFVDFIHRTARDWATQPDTWDMICGCYEEYFDPHLSILEADTYALSDRSYARLDLNTSIWDTVKRSLWHASEVEDAPENRERLMECLKKFDEKVAERQGLVPQSWAKLSSSVVSKSHWSSQWSSAPFGVGNTFLGITAQFSVLPYIKSMLLSDQGLGCQRFSNQTLGLLENAIFGYSYYTSSDVSQDGVRPQIPHDRRLATVKYLLEQGVYQSKVHTRDGVRDLKEEIQKQSQTDPEYYSAIAEYLEEVAPLKLAVRSASVRFSIRVKSLIGRDQAVRRK